MQIIEALRHANSAQEVCFLLTSYVETLQCYDTTWQLAEDVTALPVRGLCDIAARLASLRDARYVNPHFTSGSSDSAVLDEAINLFGEALYRLNALDDEEVEQFTYDRRAAARPNPVQLL